MKRSAGAAALDKDKGKGGAGPAKRVPAMFLPKSKTPSFAAPAAASQDPRRICCWNINGLGPRLRTPEGPAQIRAFMDRFEPDVLFLSEVRFKAASEGERFRPDGRERQDCDALKRSLRGPDGCFSGYSIKLSLATKKYAGSAVLVRKSATASGSEDAAQPRAEASRAQAPRPVKIWFELPAPAALAEERSPAQQPHEVDGRIILLEWKSLFTLHTYSPNNGTSEASFERRRRWDGKLTAWLEAMAASASTKPVVYVGDLNVAPTAADLSDEKFFKRRCAEAANPDDRGQPGCTANEQRRFRHMLQRGKLVDAFRLADEQLHPNRGTALVAPLFSWRGRPGDKRPQAGKFFEKGMRIDHMLVAERLADRVTRADITGRGSDCTDPSFLGSDHCPLLLDLGPAPPPGSSSSSSSSSSAAPSSSSSSSASSSSSS